MTVAHVRLAMNDGTMRGIPWPGNSLNKVAMEIMVWLQEPWVQLQTSSQAEWVRTDSISRFEVRPS